MDRPGETAFGRMQGWWAASRPLNSGPLCGWGRDSMDYKQFYAALYAPLVTGIGPIDKDTIAAIIGFDAGGPLNFCTIGVDGGSKIITYVSCELAAREEQVPAKQGGYRYELLSSCDDEGWVRKVLTSLGRMSMEVA